MAYDFPNAPTVGQLYQGYIYDGEKWIATTTPSPPNQSGVISIQVFTASGQYTPSAEHDDVRDRMRRRWRWWRWRDRACRLLHWRRRRRRRRYARTTATAARSVLRKP